MTYTGPTYTRREALDLLASVTATAFLMPPRATRGNRRAPPLDPTKRWLNHYIDQAGNWSQGQNDRLNFPKTLVVGGYNVRIHETNVGGMVILSPNTGQPTSYGEPEVYARINYVGGSWEYLSAPLATPIDLENVDTIDLNILIRVSDGRATQVQYRALVNAHCVYEMNGAVDSLLFDHAAIASAIEWEEPAGFQSFPQWSQTRKDELRDAVRGLQQGSAPALRDPPPNIKTLADDDFANTVLGAGDAWALYLAHVAQSLYIEIDRKVAWSLTDYSIPELRMLLSSKWMFEWSAAEGGYNLQRTHWGAAGAGWPDRGWCVPAPPAAIYQFLTTAGAIVADRLQTTANVVGWCQQNMIHFFGFMTAANAELQWQYRGLPPVSRIIAGTQLTGSPTSAVQHRTGGCHGTNGFLVAVLRVVNIPAEYFTGSQTGHATPHFVADGRYLSHGDDPYNGFARGTPPPYPPVELFIDQAQFDAWFGAAVPSATRSNNVGRRVFELALIYLPNYLLRMHCDDTAAGRNHAASNVAAALNRWYTVAQLEALNLWTRMDQRILERGGCANIP